MEERTISIGGEELRITRFRGLKAILAGALVTRVIRELPEIQESLNKFAKEYRDKNTVTITPAMARLPRFAVLGLTTEDFQIAGGNIELPDEPTGQQVMLAVVPELFDLARKELQRFLALIVISNGELERADDADEVDIALDRQGKQLFRKGDVDELLELVIVGWEVLQDQILAKSEKLGKLQQIPFVRMLLSMTQEPSTSSEDLDVPTLDEDLTPPISPEDVPNSSTDSEQPMDGAEEQLSTEPLGMS